MSLPLFLHKNLWLLNQEKIFQTLKLEKAILSVVRLQLEEIECTTSWKD